MIHILLHFLVPLIVALSLYRQRWKQATAIMIATMIVDVDHLLANPIYDPNRCSINFHPLHTTPAIVVYGVFCVVGLVLWWRKSDHEHAKWFIAGHLIGVGLLIHMVLDLGDCLIGQAPG